MSCQADPMWMRLLIIDYLTLERGGRGEKYVSHVFPPPIWNTSSCEAETNCLKRYNLETQMPSQTSSLPSRLCYHGKQTTKLPHRIWIYGKVKIVNNLAFIKTLHWADIKVCSKSVCTKLKHWCCSSTMGFVGFLSVRYRWKALNE